MSQSKIDQIKNVKVLITHGGIFHADDIMSTALLIICHNISRELTDYIDDCSIESSEGLHPYEVEKEWAGKIYKKHNCLDSDNIRPLVIRTNNLDAVKDGLIEEGCEEKDIIIYDIGYGEFDHHQKNADIRENGVKYAAFGLLFREFGEILFSNENDQLRFDESICQAIDAADNGCGKNMISSFINAFRPAWDDCNSMTNAFHDAYKTAFTYILRMREQILASRRAINVLERSVTCETDGGKIILLDRYVPHNEWCYNHGISAAVYPSNRGGYACSVISVPGGDNTCRFPMNWRGLTADVLVTETRIDGMMFCHNSGFMISADTQMACIQATNYLEPYAPNNTEK